MKNTDGKNKLQINNRKLKQNKPESKHNWLTALDICVYDAVSTLSSLDIVATETGGPESLAAECPTDVIPEFTAGDIPLTVGMALFLHGVASDGVVSMPGLTGLVSMLDLWATGPKLLVLCDNGKGRAEAGLDTTGLAELLSADEPVHSSRTFALWSVSHCLNICHQHQQLVITVTNCRCFRVIIN